MLIRNFFRIHLHNRSQPDPNRKRTCQIALPSNRKWNHLLGKQMPACADSHVLPLRKYFLVVSLEQESKGTWYECYSRLDNLFYRLMRKPPMNPWPGADRAALVKQIKIKGSIISIFSYLKTFRMVATVNASLLNWMLSIVLANLNWRQSTHVRRIDINLSFAGFSWNTGTKLIECPVRSKFTQSSLNSSTSQLNYDTKTSNECT